MEENDRSGKCEVGVGAVLVVHSERDRMKCSVAFLAQHERIVNSAQMEQRYYFGYSDDVNRIFCVGNDKKIFFRYNYKGSFSLLREAFLHYR